MARYYQDRAGRWRDSDNQGRLVPEFYPDTRSPSGWRHRSGRYARLSEIPEAERRWRKVEARREESGAPPVQPAPPSLWDLESQEWNEGVFLVNGEVVSSAPPLGPILFNGYDDVVPALLPIIEQLMFGFRRVCDRRFYWKIDLELIAIMNGREVTMSGSARGSKVIRRLNRLLTPGKQERIIRGCRNGLAVRMIRSIYEEMTEMLLLAQREEPRLYDMVRLNQNIWSCIKIRITGEAVEKPA